MKYIFYTACIVCAAYLKYYGIEGWAWFLVIAALV